MYTVNSAGVFRWPTNKALPKTPILLSTGRQDNIVSMLHLVERDRALILQTDKKYEPALRKWEQGAAKYMKADKYGEEEKFTEAEIRTFYDAHRKLRSFYINRAASQLPERWMIATDSRFKPFLFTIGYELDAELNRNICFEPPPGRDRVYR